MSTPKKKFKETKVGKFLLGKSGIINVIGDILPDQGALGMVKNLIDKDVDLPPQDKETALKLLEQDMMGQRYEIRFMAFKKYTTNNINIFNNISCYFYFVRWF